MADVILDAVFEIVQIALLQNNFSNDVALVKDYTNLSVVLKLQNWANLSIGEEEKSNFSISGDEGEIEDFDDCGENTFLAEPAKAAEPAKPAEPAVEIVVKMESDVNEPQLESTINGCKTEGSKQLVNCSVYLVRVDANNCLKGSWKNEESGSQSEQTGVPRNAKAVIKKSIAPKKSRKKRRPSNEGIKLTNLNVKYKIPSKYLSKYLKSKKKDSKKTYVKERKLKCEVCGHTTDSQPRLARHLSTHTTEKPIACTLCDFRCKRDDLLMDHMLTHTGEKPYKCSQCDSSFRYRQHRSAHVKTWHSDIKSYSCQYCDYTAKLRGTMRIHENTIHLKQTKLYKCQQCGATTLNEAKHKKHVRAHELNISFDCFCGKSFTNSNEHREHLKGVHNGERRSNVKKVSCPVCDKKYKYKTTLKSHMYLHTGVNAFHCRLCGLGFRRLPSVKKHRDRKHPNEPLFHCQPCNFFTDSSREKTRHDTSLMHLGKIPNAASTDEGEISTALNTAIVDYGEKS